MKIHILEHEQILPISLEEAWDFFSDPANLEALTPPGIRIHITSGAGERMFAGQVVSYRIRILPGVSTTWLTEIPVVDAPHQFVDVQRFGPYRYWHHLHRFEAVEGGVRIRDRVHYGIGLGPLGAMAHALFVRRKLAQIFAFRREVLERLFGDRGLQAAAAVS